MLKWLPDTRHGNLRKPHIQCNANLKSRKVLCPGLEASLMAWRLFRSLVERLLLASLGVILALVVAEFALRIVQNHPLLPLIPPEPYIDNSVLYQRTPMRRYELTPGAEGIVGDNLIHIRINAAGFRDEWDYPTAKPPGTYRVVVLGNSFTFAGKVALADTAPKQLETLLNQSDPSRHYQVLNGGIPGYHTEQELLLLEERALAYQPDLVILNLTLTDALPMGQLAGKSSHIPLPIRQALKRFYLVQFAYASYVRLKTIASAGTFKADADVAPMAEGTPGWQRAKGALAQFKRLTSENDAQLLLVIWPMFDSLDDHYPYEVQHALVFQTCQDLGIPVLDLLPTFIGKTTALLWVGTDDHHPNRLAQQLAAVAIFKALLATQLFAPTASP
jgi:hypothetical protein